MPKSASGGKVKAPAQASPVRKRSSRSRTRVETTDDSSRPSSPSRRGRPPGTRGRSRSPARTTKTTKNEAVSGRRGLGNSIGTDDTDVGTLLRSRKAPQTAHNDHNHYEKVPNGTNVLTVDITKLPDSYSQKLRSSDAPRTPKINTTIFDNIQLTPSVKGVSGIGEILEREKLATPVPAKQISKQQRVKEAVGNSMAWMRKVTRQCYANLPSWKVMLGIFLFVAFFCFCLYVYLYQWEAAMDYYHIAKAEVQKKLLKKEKEL